MTLRPARDTDAEAIAEIYNHYIETSTATFDMELKTVAERIEWLASHDERHPVIVAERDGRVVGWGSLSRWATRPAWARTVEVSVYIADVERGSGIGPVILGKLIELGREVGHHALIAQIVGGNKPSLEMVRRAGFEQVGTLKEVGLKFGDWLDVVIVQLLLPVAPAAVADA